VNDFITLQYVTGDNGSFDILSHLNGTCRIIHENPRIVIIPLPHARAVVMRGRQAHTKKNNKRATRFCVNF